MRHVSLAALILGGLATLSSIAHADNWNLDADTQVGAAINYKNLTIFPLTATAEAKLPTGDYISLDEGFAKNEVKVDEKGDGEVNTLTLENKSKKPLFVMSGEVVIGGKQDRIIGKDTIIPPSQKADIPVFCVEHGRWTAQDGGGKHFRSGKSMAHAKLRVRASGRDDQSQVWAEVQTKNAEHNAESATGTYRQVATGGGGVEEEVKPYAEFFTAALDKVPSHERLVGVIIALNGNVVGIEQFGSPTLFGKVRDKLLRSYYVDAVDVPVDAAAKEPNKADITSFAAPPAAVAEPVAQHGAVTTERKKGNGVIDNEVMDKASPSPAKPVYKSVQKDQ